MKLSDVMSRVDAPEAKFRIGDAIAAIATPIARMVGADCVDPETNELRPESPCAQRKQMLNEGRYSDAVYSFFHHQQQDKTK